MIDVKTPLKLAAILALALALGTTPAAASSPLNLRPYYPGPVSQYLVGQNYQPNPAAPSAAVLWFENQDQWTFLQHNWGPPEACHSDQLSWWPDGYLRYVSTTDACPGHPVEKILYANPIIFIPQYWSGNYWSLHGTSTATYTVGGVPRCTGTTSWTAEVFGWETMAPGESGLHWRTTQTTPWTQGDVPGGCWAGWTTRWQEDYWFVDDLPGATGPSKGLKRTSGGNLDSSGGRWDIWFDHRSPLN